MNLNVKCYLKEVGPSVAQEWLSEKWGDQRNMRSAHVTRLSSDMKSGLFKTGPDAILRIKGKLANGQHRLSAVVDSGTTQTFLVMESDDEELYKVLDAGVKRTVTDALIGCLYASNIPSVARWVMAYQMEGISKTSFSGAGMVNRKVSQIEVVNYCQENLEVLTEAVGFVLPLYDNTRLLPLAVSGALYVICANKPEVFEQGRDFLEKLYISGGENAAGDLRNRLISNKGSRAKIPTGYLFGLCLKTLKSYINGTRPGTLKWADSEPLTII